MTEVERVKNLLEQEMETLKRTELEVTVDYPAVRAELRAECLTEVLKILESRP